MSHDPYRTGQTPDPAVGGRGYPPPTDYPATDYPAGLGPRTGGFLHADPAAEPARSNGLAVGGFVCSAVGGALAFIPYAGILGFPVLAVGLVLCAVGLNRGRVHRGLAIAGLVVALVALPVDALVTAATLSSHNSSTTISSGSYNQDDSSSSSSGGYSSSVGGSRYSGSANDQAYLRALERYGVNAGSDANAVGLGHAVCSYLAQGGTDSGAAQVLTGEGFTSYSADVIVGAAEGAYCSN